MLPPGWNRAARYLAVSPHPDDAELGCGGTLWELASQGSHVTLAVFTDGRLGTRDPRVSPEAMAVVRAEEARAAARELGLSLRLLGHPDGGPHDYYRLRDEAVRLLREERPEYVFSCDPFLPYEVHSDHRMVGLAVSEAVLLSGLVHYDQGLGLPHEVQGILYYFPRRATLLSPLTPQGLSARRRAIGCHRSQFRAGDAYLARLEAQIARYGAGAGIQAAEPLHLRERTALHIPDPDP